MKIRLLLQASITLSLLSCALMANQCLAQAAGSSASGYDWLGDSGGTGTVGSSLPDGHTNQPVQGEYHPYSLTGQDESAFQYPNQSQAGPSAGTAKQIPSGLPIVTTKLIANDPANQFGGSQDLPIPSGHWTFGFDGNADAQYHGPYTGGPDYAVGGQLPHTSTSSVDLNVGGF
jgi:hypothetical protein